jgi:Ca2+-binding RTX toxin-like protein
MMFETLEGRRLLSGVVATQVGDTVVYQLPDGGAGIHVFENANTVFAQDVNFAQVGPVFSGVNHVVIKGGSGDDIIHYTGDNQANVVISGGAGNDTIVVDTLTDTAPTSFIDGGDGNDFIIVLGGKDSVVYGGNGDDTLASAGGMDQLIDGGNGKDTIIAFANDSIVTGGNGTDFVAVIGSNDLALGGNGKDIVVTTQTDQVIALQQQVAGVLDGLPGGLF